MERIGVVSAIGEAWGGCEELWAKSAVLMVKEGMDVTVYKAAVDRHHPRITALIKVGIRFVELQPSRSKRSTLARKLAVKAKCAFHGSFDDFVKVDPFWSFYEYLSMRKPKLMLISQGINFDAMGYAYICRKLGIPYVIVSHKAVDFYWPPACHRELFRGLFQESRANYFVSRHNLRLTEEQFAVRLPNAEVVFNPVKSRTQVAYPSMSDGLSLCCVGRYFVGDKGQDILLRVLARPQWKDRPIRITFLGAGQDHLALVELATFLGVGNVMFLPYTDDLISIWEQHHALILPSRCEGLPLTIIEAMFAGRPVIATDVGGNAEMVKEGQTGFLGSPDESGLDQAMERAWSHRDSWQAMGQAAAIEMNQVIPESPESVFVGKVKKQLWRL